MTSGAREAKRAGARDRRADEIVAVLRRSVERTGGAILHELAPADPTIDPGRISWLSERPGLTLLRASGRASESAYPFGTAMQLLDDLLLEDFGAAHFAGAGRLAAQLITGELKLDRLGQVSEAFLVIRSLTAVVLHVARTVEDGTGPVVLWIDSMQHVDAPSLRFLAYLAPRIEALPVAMILLGESDGTYTDHDAIAAIRAHAGVASAPSIQDGAGEDGAGQDGAGRSSPRHEAPPSQGIATAKAARSVDAEPAELAQLAARAGLAGDHRARVRELVMEAWVADGVQELLLTRPWLSAQLLRGLLAVDELELAQDILGDARQLRAEQSDPGAAGAACEFRAWTLFHQGRIIAATEEAKRGLDQDPPDDIRQSLQAVVASGLIHSGRLTEAESLLKSLDGLTRHHARVLPLLLETRGQLRLAQRQAADALRDAMEARRRSSTSDPQSFGPASWRIIAARANTALQRVDAARELATRELELADARDVRRRSIAAFRALAAASPAEDQVVLLERAVALGDTGPPRLEHLCAMVDLGSALRRTNHRRAARSVLGRAFALADDLGAAGTTRRVREELAAAGGRRPQAMASGVDALTPSERRVANLAASGRSTRQIAGELFITNKTVEFHLRHIYRKLEIPSSRDELVRALRPAEAGSATPPRPETSDADAP